MASVHVGRSVEREVFAPSTGPEQTQPIITHEQIEISSIVDPVFEEQSIAQVGRPAEIAAQARSGSDWWLGDDNLAAAMRWYVDSKFGQEVPDGESL
ncbi:DUF2591 family protein [Paraburkholderia panacisoli]|uniref:DUF2591 family protein n=1 Tax=Paraburkholderia panacisoli TaxID=2603818 RepID=UPI00165ECB24|nr:DUF2591 family protein [Paraburkholderia panacisoli]